MKKFHLSCIVAFLLVCPVGLADDDLNPQQARSLPVPALTKTVKLKKTRSIFTEY